MKEIPKTAAAALPKRKDAGAGTAVSKKDQNAVTLRMQLWEIFAELRRDAIDTKKANALARTAREIIRSARTQLEISRAGEEIPDSLSQFGGEE